MKKELQLLLDVFVNWDSIGPILLDDEWLIKTINYLTNKNYFDINNLKEDFLPNLFIYETEEKNFKIEKTREIIEKSQIRTGYDFNIFVIREIDKLTDQAANSLLKIFEDVPDRVVFLLTTNSKENILETIASRIVNFWSNNLFFEINNEIKNTIDDFFCNNKLELIRICHSHKFEKHEVIWILQYIFEKTKTIYINPEIISQIQKWIEIINSTNANPKYILDNIIFEMTKNIK